MRQRIHCGMKLLTPETKVDSACLAFRAVGQPVSLAEQAQGRGVAGQEVGNVLECDGLRVFPRGLGKTKLQRAPGGFEKARGIMMVGAVVGFGQREAQGFCLREFYKFCQPGRMPQPSADPRSGGTGEGHSC